MDGERYCQRCGEDAWFFARCDTCHREFCEDCATRREWNNQMCATCLPQEDEVYDAVVVAEPPLPMSRVLPCMREWYAKSVAGAEAGKP